MAGGLRVISPDNSRHSRTVKQGECMKRYLMPVFCTVFLFSGWTAIETNAQTASAEAQAHVAKAKAVAYRPDHDISDTFDSMCNPLKPGATQISGAPSPGPRAPRSKEPYAWWAPATKVF